MPMTLIIRRTTRWVGRAKSSAHREVQVEQLGVGGDFHYDNVRARIMTQFGMYSATTPRNDASPGHGQWDLDTAYRYVSEAYGGYHFNVLHGINRRRRNLHVLHWPFQLLQFRQLGLSTLLCLLEHALVLQRRASPDFSHGPSED